MEQERKHGTAVAMAGQGPETDPGSHATPGTGDAAAFRFAALGRELVIAGVFVGVYNQQPSFPVVDPASFCKGLVTFIHSHMKPEVYYPSLTHRSSQDQQAGPDDKDGEHGMTAGARQEQASRAGQMEGQAQDSGQHSQGQSQSQPSGEGEDGGQRSRQEVLQALQALINVLQAVPKLTALMASRPAITPLLSCIQPICRYALFFQ